MSKYIKKVSLPTAPKLSQEEGNIIIDEFNNTYENRFSNLQMAYERPDLSTYTATYAESSLDVPVKGFYYLWIPHLIGLLFEHKNVSAEFHNYAGIQAIAHIDTLRPHTDYSRYINLIYNVSGLAETVFYEAKDPAAHKAGKLYNRDEIVEVERCRLELHQWYFLNTNAIHSVENINNQTRVSISVSITDPFDSFEDTCAALEQRLFL